MSMSQLTLDNDAILARVRTNWRARLPPSAESSAFSGSSGWEDVRSFVARDLDTQESTLRSRSLSVRTDVFVQETQDTTQAGTLDQGGTYVDSSQACEQFPKTLQMEPDDILDPPSEAELPASEEEVEVFDAVPEPLADLLPHPSTRPVISEPTARPTTSEHRPIMSDSRPVVIDHRPSDHRPVPVVSDHRPVTDHRPITDHRPVVSDHRPISTNPKSVMSDRKPVISNHRPLTTIPKPIPNPRPAPIVASSLPEVPSSNLEHTSLPSSAEFIPSPESPPSGSLGRTISSPMSRRSEHSVITSIPSPEPSDYRSKWSECVSAREQRLQNKKVEHVQRPRSASLPEAYCTTPQDSRQKTKHILADVESILTNTDGPERRRRTRKRTGVLRELSCMPDRAEEDPLASFLPDRAEEEDPLESYLPDHAEDVAADQDLAATVPVPAELPLSVPSLEPLSPPKLPSQKPPSQWKPFPSPDKPSQFRSTAQSRRDSLDSLATPTTAKSEFSSLTRSAEAVPLVSALLVRDTPSPVVASTFESPPFSRSSVLPKSTHSTHLQTPARTLLPILNSPQILPPSPQIFQTTPPPEITSSTPSPLPITPLHPEPLPATQPYPTSPKLEPIRLWDDEAQNFECASQILDFPSIAIEPPKEKRPKKPKPPKAKPVVARDEMSQLLDFAPMFSRPKKSRTTY